MGFEYPNVGMRDGWAQADPEAEQCLMDAEACFACQIGSQVGPDGLSQANFETTLQVRISAFEAQDRNAHRYNGLTRLSPPVAEHYEIQMSLRRRRTPYE